MTATESGTFRVYGSDRDEGELSFVEQGTEQPTYVRTGGYDASLAEAVADLRPGHLVEATLDWSQEPAAITDLAVLHRTLLFVADDTPDIFERAKEAFQQARTEEMPIYPTQTFDTDGEPNGVLYVVARQAGERDLFAEFCDGRKTIEPMLGKVEAGGVEPPYEVFCIRPATEPFFVIYIALDAGGLLAETLHDEYDPEHP
ncbi:DUF6663 family protein [Halorientalis regularis]|jgi:hypothetical protein|uniref:Uncharacterized protein n=1 Tax=Halorientalis regularis TaxID=660518 RepID=A0A1G7PXU0_9EURY|nr:DUF6663 family protein [Halorientalis regularis]SDF91084.1 hypothetical protein SAMN05216218_11169 [Halorientalis regularis]